LVLRVDSVLERCLHQATRTESTMSTEPTPCPKAFFLYTLALGTFAIGTESFMIAGLLPRIASDLWLVDQGSGGCGYP
jgi:hypothetical protein